MEERKDQKQNEGQQFRERVEKEVANLSSPEILTNTLDTIQTAIGVDAFDFLSNLIEGVENLNPQRKARKKIFLTDGPRKRDRDDLSKRLKLWVDVLTSDNDLYQMVESCEKVYDQNKQLYQENLGRAVEDVKAIEQSYRTLALFYRNTNESRANSVSIMNAPIKMLIDHDVTSFTEAIDNELNSKYDRLDLCNNYSLLVLPGFLESKQNIAEWARRAHQYKVMLLTDHRGDMFDKAEDLIDSVAKDNLTGGEDYLSNVILTSNWLVGREKHAEINEEEPLFIPPSAVMAGRLYGTSISQVVAGKKFGELLGVQGTMVPLLKSELGRLRELGVVPMVSEWGKIMAFSDKTLYDGSDTKFQTYSIVRVYDYLGKVLVDFCNRRAFENFDEKTMRDFRVQITTYLETKKWDDKIIENYEIVDIHKEDDKVFIDINLTPLYPAVSFKINLEAEKEGDQFNFKSN